MLEKLKSKAKKFYLLASGKYRHLDTTVKATKAWYGNNYGGFFVCPDFLSTDSIVYSFGIGEDISFDHSLIKRHNCRVFGFDPTPKSVQWIQGQGSSIPSTFKFYNYGLSDTSGFVDFYLPKNAEHVSGSLVIQDNVDHHRSLKVCMKTLREITMELGHSRIDVLKMDIEGAEYQVIDTIVQSEVPIKQLAIEFHDRFFEDGRQRTITAIEKLRDYGFQIFAVSDSLEEVSFLNTKA